MSAHFLCNMMYNLDLELGLVLRFMGHTFVYLFRSVKEVSPNHLPHISLQGWNVGNVGM